MRGGLAIALVGALMALVACGGDSSGDPASLQVVRDFVDEYRAGDYSAACERVNPNTQSAELPALAGLDEVDPDTGAPITAPCDELLSKAAHAGSPLDDDAVLDVTSVDESDVADSSTIETRGGTWTLQSSGDAPGGWIIIGLPQTQP